VEGGLQPVLNPSTIFLSERDAAADVSAAVTAVMEGSHPMLLEVQALCSKAHDRSEGVRRNATGVPFNRSEGAPAPLTTRSAAPLRPALASSRSKGELVRRFKQASIQGVLAYYLSRG